MIYMFIFYVLHQNAGYMPVEVASVLFSSVRQPRISLAHTKYSINIYICMHPRYQALLYILRLRQFLSI